MMYYYYQLMQLMNKLKNIEDIFYYLYILIKLIILKQRMLLKLYNKLIKRFKTLNKSKFINEYIKKHWIKQNGKEIKKINKGLKISKKNYLMKLLMMI